MPGSCNSGPTVPAPTIVSTRSNEMHENGARVGGERLGAREGVRDMLR